MADLNITFRKPVKFTINGTEYAVKPLPADIGFKLSLTMEKLMKQQDTADAATLTADTMKAYDMVAEAFADNAVKPDETRDILEALKENDGITWARLLMAIAKKLMS